MVAHERVQLPNAADVDLMGASQIPRVHANDRRARRHGAPERDRLVRLQKHAHVRDG